ERGAARRRSWARARESWSKVRYGLVGTTLGIKTNGGGRGNSSAGPCSSAGPSPGISLLKSLLKSFASFESRTVLPSEVSEGLFPIVFAASSLALLAGPKTATSATEKFAFRVDGVHTSTT